MLLRGWIQDLLNEGVALCPTDHGRMGEGMVRRKLGAGQGPDTQSREAHPHQHYWHCPWLLCAVGGCVGGVGENQVAPALHQLGLVEASLSQGHWWQHSFLLSAPIPAYTPQPPFWHSHWLGAGLEEKSVCCCCCPQMNCACIAVLCSMGLKRVRSALRFMWGVEWADCRCWKEESACRCCCCPRLRLGLSTATSHSWSGSRAGKEAPLYPTLDPSLFTDLMLSP